MEPKTSLAVITEQLGETGQILEFLANARRHGHSIDSLIVGHTLGVSPEAARVLGKETRLITVKVGGGDSVFQSALREAGVSDEDIEVAFVSKSLPKCGKTTYARYRNTVLAAGLLAGSEHLLFFDTDVHPCLLLPDEDSMEVPAVRYQDIDFVGCHKEYLCKSDVFVTTSDYAGYYILPPMQFDGLKDLLVGIQKEGAYEFLCGSGEHHCLNFAHHKRQPFVTQKLLGGNLGIDLMVADKLPPFYSTFFMFDGHPVQGRGEDTLMGFEVASAGGVAMDIDLLIFHDTFGDFPTVPDTTKQSTRDRFYRGCLGWIARNPFFNWFRRKAGVEKRERAEVIEQQRRHLVPGAAAAARALDDERFLRLPDAFDLSVSMQDQMVADFELLSAAWARITQSLVSRSRRSRTSH